MFMFINVYVGVHINVHDLLVHLFMYDIHVTYVGCPFISLGSETKAKMSQAK